MTVNRVDRIVELIDHALDDYGASGDAMRWTPEPRPQSWSEGLIWDLIHPAALPDIPSGHFLTTFNEYGVRHHEMSADGVLSSWLRLRPIPPAESVTIDLSVWD